MKIPINSNQVLDKSKIEIQIKAGVEQRNERMEPAEELD